MREKNRDKKNRDKKERERERQNWAIKENHLIDWDDDDTDIFSFSSYFVYYNTTSNKTHGSYRISRVLQQVIKQKCKGKDGNLSRTETCEDF